MRTGFLIVAIVCVLSAFLASRFVFPIARSELGTIGALVILSILVYVPTRLTEACVDKRSKRAQT